VETLGSGAQIIGTNNYEGAPADGSAWEKEGDATRRVVRGGSWYGNLETYCRVSLRLRLIADIWDSRYRFSSSPVLTLYFFYPFTFFGVLIAGGFKFFLEILV
jgi:hypothetical protein